MNATKFFSGLIMCSIFALNAVVTPEEKENLGKALISAAQWGSYEEVKKLLDFGADINFRGYDYKETALHWAVYRGNLEMTKLLVARGADVNVKQVEGNTPLILVVQQYSIKEEVCLKIMEVLLTVKGIKVNYKNEFGETAISWAALQERVKECELLLKHGSSANIANDKWEYPTDLVSYNKNLKQKLHPTGLYRFIHWLKE